MVYFQWGSVALINAQEAGERLEEAKSLQECIFRNAKSQYGMLGVHEADGRMYLEIPDSLLGRDILAVNRLSKGWAGDKPFDSFRNFLGYSGDLAGETMFRFDKGAESTLHIAVIDYEERVYAEDGSPMLLPNANLLPALHSFPVLCRNKANDATVVDGTDFLSGDNAVMTFSTTLRKKFGVSSMNGQHSSLQRVEVRPAHTVTSSIKTYGYRGKQVQLAMRSTWFLLPKVPYEIREADRRVGYYTQSAKDYSDPLQPEQHFNMVKRWRMEPRPEDRVAYFRGELVEPTKPIVIYIDPAMPKEWVPYMIQGINEWQQAFEQAGFKNAIRGERVPPGMESEMVGDARYSMINYKPNRVRNATAEIVTDPRSGEILNAHIAWWHGHMQNLIKWGFVMASIHRQKHWEDESTLDTAFIGAMIRKTAAHEVGHVLGLMHNFGASSAVSVENLRNTKWLADNAITPSIMDYVRVNYVAQPEDRVPLSGLIPRIGTYDRWAIEWGYRCWPTSGKPKTDRERLDRWTAETGDSGMRWYGAEARQHIDPRCRAEDLGHNPLLSATYGMRNLKRLADNAARWETSMARFGLGWSELFDQYATYLKHVVAAVDAPSVDYREALDFLDQHFFHRPDWLPKAMPQEELPNDLLSSVRKLNQEIIPRLISGAAKQSDSERILALQKVMFNSEPSQDASDPYKRAVQHTYVSHLCGMLDGASKETGSALLHENRLVLQIAARALHQRLQDDMQVKADRLAKIHLTGLIQELRKIITNS